MGPLECWKKQSHEKWAHLGHSLRSQYRVMRWFCIVWRPVEKNPFYQRNEKKSLFFVYFWLSNAKISQNKTRI